MVYFKYIFFNSVVKFNFLKVQVHVYTVFKYKIFYRYWGYKDFFFQKLRVCVFSVILTNFLCRRSLKPGWQVVVDDADIKNPANLQYFISFFTDGITCILNSLILCSIIHVHKQLKFIKMFYVCMLTRNTLK